MEKENFLRVVDESLHTLRKRLLEAYPQESGSLPLEKELRKEEEPHAKQRLSQQSGNSLHLELEVQRVESKEEDQQKNPELVPAFEALETSEIDGNHSETTQNSMKNHEKSMDIMSFPPGRAAKRRRRPSAAGCACGLEP